LTDDQQAVGSLSVIDRDGGTIWIADAHRDDGKRFVVHADEILTAFLKLESAIRRNLNNVPNHRSPVIGSKANVPDASD